MKPLGKTARNWLFTFHILFVAIWIGTALFTILLRLFNHDMTSGDALYSLHILTNRSDYLILPSVAGVFITSLMISTLTEWGFFKFRWMIVVWIILLAQVIFGAAVLGPLSDNILAIAERDGLAALQNPIYTRDHTLLFFGGILQVLVLALVILIVKFKPWGRRQVQQ
jgi:hypothetical protein